ncbi:MAG TPA: FAD-dependent oxidoreductase [Candidatus Binataceae bacterium]|nr:FAD-dependent oxidoreductase [Candidatus Binataceae bacterium]
MSGAPSGRTVQIARVVRMLDRASDTRSLFLEPANGRPLGFVPGQFISIQIPLPDELRSRAYTVASDPGERDFEVVFNRVPGGRGVEWLFAREPGDEISFVGPFGSFTLEHPPAVETVFLAEGTAIAPIRPILRRASTLAAHPQLTLLYAAVSERNLLYCDEFRELAGRDRGVSLETLVGPTTEVHRWLRVETERRYVLADRERSRQFYICGVGKAVIELRDLLRGAGYERRAVHYEQW